MESNREIPPCKGLKRYSCLECNTPVSNEIHVLSTGFRSGTSTAFLLKHVWNVVRGNAETRMFTTGRHIIYRVYCINCESELGWEYAYAYQRSQEYKVDSFCLELRHLLEYTG